MAATSGSVGLWVGSMAATNGRVGWWVGSMAATNGRVGSNGSDGALTAQP